MGPKNRLSTSRDLGVSKISVKEQYPRIPPHQWTGSGATRKGRARRRNYKLL